MTINIIDNFDISDDSIWTPQVSLNVAKASEFHKYESAHTSSTNQVDGKSYQDMGWVY